jgi:hypothetical protein
MVACRSALLSGCAYYQLSFARKPIVGEPLINGQVATSTLINEAFQSTLADLDQ